MSSKGSTPVHTGSPFDPYFDPDFTAEISAKMHVPDKICVVEGLQNSSSIVQPKEEIRTMMNVPERIIVAGDNKHIAARESVPELRFERAFPTTAPNYILEAPPSVLTVDDYSYPSADFKRVAPKDVKKNRSFTLDQPPSGIDLNETSVSCAAPEEEIVMMKKQLRHLSRRVLTLEQENQQRQQREIILYAVGITYFVLKGVIWLHRHF